MRDDETAISGHGGDAQPCRRLGSSAAAGDTPGVPLPVGDLLRREGHPLPPTSPDGDVDGRAAFAIPVPRHRAAAAGRAAAGAGGLVAAGSFLGAALLAAAGIGGPIFSGLPDDGADQVVDEGTPVGQGGRPAGAVTGAQVVSASGILRAAFGEVLPVEPAAAGPSGFRPAGVGARQPVVGRAPAVVAAPRSGTALEGVGAGVAPVPAVLPGVLGAPALQPVVGAVAPVTTPLAPVITPVDPVIDALAPVVEPVGGVVAPVVPVVEPVLEPVGDAVEPVGGVVAPVVRPVAPVVGAAVAPAVDAVPRVLAPVAPVVDAVVPAVAPIVPAPILSGAVEDVQDVELPTVELPVVAPLPVPRTADGPGGRTAAPAAAQADRPTAVLPVVTAVAEAAETVSVQDAQDVQDDPPVAVPTAVTSADEPDEERDDVTDAVSDLGRAGLGQTSLRSDAQRDSS